MASRPERDQLIDEMLGLVVRLSDLILQRIPAQREEGYAMAREVGYEAAIKTGMTEAEADDAGEYLEAIVRAYVREVLAGEGGEGGRA